MTAEVSGSETKDGERDERIFLGGCTFLGEVS